MDTADHIPHACARILAWHERRPRRAEALARRLLAATPTDAPERPWALLTLGWCLLARSSHGEAAAALREAHERLRAAGATVGALRARQGLLVAAFLQGAPAEQQAEWEELVAALEAHGCLREAAQARITQLRHLNFLGRSHEALAKAEQVRAAVERDGGPAERALLWRILGIAHLQTGDLAAAERALARAAEGFQRLRYKADLAMTWFEQGRVAHAQERYELALSLQQRAREAFAAQSLPMWVAFCEKNIGAIAGKLGRPDRAIAHLLAARDAFLGLGLPAHAADCELNLGTAAYHSGLYDLALAAWRRAEARYAALGARGMELRSQRNQPEALLRLGQPQTAADLLAELIPRAEQLGARGDLGEAHHVLGEALIALGEAERARDSLRRAEQIFEALPNRPAAARARLAQGWIALRAGAVEEAAGHFQQAARGLLEVARTTAGAPAMAWAAARSCGASGGRPWPTTARPAPACPTCAAAWPTPAPRARSSTRPASWSPARCASPPPRAMPSRRSRSPSSSAPWPSSSSSSASRSSSRPRSRPTTRRASGSCGRRRRGAPRARSWTPR